MKINILTALLFFLSSQVNYYVDSNSSITIKGTSTLHDWEMKTSKFSGDVSFEIVENEIKGVKSLSIIIPVESLKSDKTAMDKNAYKSLKASEFKNISFKMSKLNRIEKSGEQYKITCDGVLEIAGKAKNTTITSICTRKGNGVIQCVGEKTLKMTEYNVEPPSFMFGSVKTGDEITITFNVTLKES